MTYISNTEYITEVARGNVAGASLVTKFGRGDVGNTLVPITLSGTYQMPTTAQTIEIVSDSDEDYASGAGAREVTVIGLGADWTEVIQTVIPNKAAPVTLGTDLIRLYRMYVSLSGTYATMSTGSHAGTLTVQNSGAGVVWGILDVNSYAHGQSLIGAYTIPAGKVGWIVSQDIAVDSSKTIDILMFHRLNADDVTSPYTGTMRIVDEHIGVVGSHPSPSVAPFGPFLGPCDISYLGKVTSGTSPASVSFQVLLYDI